MIIAAFTCVLIVHSFEFNCLRIMSSVQNADRDATAGAGAAVSAKLLAMSFSTPRAACHQFCTGQARPLRPSRLDDDRQQSLANCAHEHINRGGKTVR